MAILVGSTRTQSESVLALCSARLHQAIGYRKTFPPPDECAFIVIGLNLALLSAKDGNPNISSFILPVLRDLLDFLPWKASRLPCLPNTKANALFREEFLRYSESDEWQTFIVEVAQTASNKFESNIFSDQNFDLEHLLEIANEDAIVASHARDKLSGESKLSFENSLENAFREFLENESTRYQKAKRQLTNQQVGSLRVWRRLTRFLTGARGPWNFREKTEYFENPEEKHWKLSNVENFSRMRLKLTQNYNFEFHTEAATARDDRQGSKQ
jgi:hypothetical protein